MKFDKRFSVEIIKKYFCKFMEKVIGPTISVSQDNIYITGSSEDSLSGTAIYRYDPPNSQGKANNVDNITTGKYTAPQFELTTSGVWTFYAQDAAGNSNTKQTSNITLYRCNYCNQKTVQLHYRCPTHKDDMICTTSSGTCYITSPCEGYFDYPTYASLEKYPSPGVVCFICGRRILDEYGYGYRVMGDGARTTSTCTVCGTTRSSSDRYAGTIGWNWCREHDNPPKCNQRFYLWSNIRA